MLGVEALLSACSLQDIGHEVDVRSRSSDSTYASTDTRTYFRHLPKSPKPPFFSSQFNQFMLPPRSV